VALLAGAKLRLLILLVLVLVFVPGVRRVLAPMVLDVGLPVLALVVFDRGLRMSPGYSCQRNVGGLGDHRRRKRCNGYGICRLRSGSGSNCREQYRAACSLHECLP